MKKIAVVLMLSAVVLFAQVKVSKTEVLDLGHNTILPVFSEDGRYVVFNSLDGGKIYDLETKSTSKFAESAYDYSMDTDGKIRYREDSFVNKMKVNSVKLFDKLSGKTDVILENKRLDIVPKVTNHGVYYIENNVLKTDKTLSKAVAKPVVFSYNRSLLLYSYGTAKEMKPAGDDTFYIWPSVSPDNSMI